MLQIHKVLCSQCPIDLCHLKSVFHKCQCQFKRITVHTFSNGKYGIRLSSFQTFYRIKFFFFFKQKTAYEMLRSLVGSVIATFAVCLPSMTLMILVARYIARLKGNPLVSGAMRGLRPVVIGMIGAAALLLMFPQDAGDASFIDFWSWILFGGVLAGSYFKLNPILMIVLSAAAGIAIYL